MTVKRPTLDSLDHLGLGVKADGLRESADLHPIAGFGLLLAAADRIGQTTPAVVDGQHRLESGDDPLADAKANAQLFLLPGQPHEHGDALPVDLHRKGLFQDHGRGMVFRPGGADDLRRPGKGRRVSYFFLSDR